MEDNNTIMNKGNEEIYIESEDKPEEQSELELEYLRMVNSKLKLFNNEEQVRKM